MYVMRTQTLFFVFLFLQSNKLLNLGCKSDYDSGYYYDDIKVC